MQHTKLMIPGPVDVDESVLSAMGQPVIPPYGEAWLEIYHEILTHLQQLFGTHNDVCLIAGPGSAAIDAAFGSVLRTGEKVLVPTNGFFGDRLGQIAAAYGLHVIQPTFPLGRPIDPDALRPVLRSEPAIQALAVVHHETSTAVLNPLPEITAVAHEAGVLTIVDAVASLGGVPLPVDEWGIDICVSVINKCLACPPGLAPTSVSERAWQVMDQKAGRAHGWYLNLRTWKDYSINWADWHPHPTTMPVNNVLALQTALRAILADGPAATYARHAWAANAVRQGLRALGFEMFVPDEYACPLTTAVRALPDIGVSRLQRFLLKERGIMVSGGIAELRGQIFRVGHMGQAASRDYVLAFLFAVEEFLRAAGRAVPVGASLVGIEQPAG
jgi:alanine-glyoxylate transaminase/serine-glyoxylate transaminase/serine-pyruvate transaminase